MQTTTGSARIPAGIRRANKPARMPAPPARPVTILARAVTLVGSGLPLGDHARRFTTTPKERNKRMKIKDVPQVGKLGLTVTWPGRYGLIRRILVTPRNPR